VSNYRALCPVKLNGHGTYALVDSGNVVVNAISEKFALRLFSGNLSDNLAKLDYKHIGTAETGARMTVLGVTKQPVVLRFGGGGVKFLTSPIVIKDLNIDVNISGPFLSENGIDQIHTKGALKVKGKLIRLCTFRASREEGQVAALQAPNARPEQLTQQQGQGQQLTKQQSVPPEAKQPVTKQAKQPPPSERQQQRQHGRPPDKAAPVKEKEEITLPSSPAGSGNAYVIACRRIPANSAVFIAIRVPAIEEKKIPHGSGLLTVGERFADKTQGHPTIRAAVRTDADGKCYSSIMNLTDEDLEIQEGQFFGNYRPWPAETTAEGGISSLQDRLRQATPVKTAVVEQVTKQQRLLWLEEAFRLKESPWLQGDQVAYQKALNLLLEYDSIMSRGDEYGRTTLVQHEIRTHDVPPIKLKGKPLNPHMEANLKEQMIKWSDQGVIEESNSPWSFGLIPVQKKSGKTRWVVDFRRLNEVTLKDSYPLPNMESNLSRLAHSKVFSAIDGAGAFHAVTIRAEDRVKTAFHTPWGLYQFKQMPFGLCNAPSTYSRLVQRVLEDIPTSIALPYLDDTCIHSQTVNDHFGHLRRVFEAHRKAGLMLQPEKCHLFQKEIDYLGHRITAAGVQPRDDYIDIVKSWPLPQDLKGWRTFLGKVAYYRKFIKGFSILSGPLYALLAKECTTSPAVAVGSKEEKAFQQLKEALTRAPILAFPDFQSSSPFILDTDWSGDPGAIGGVLSQEQDGEERVICYGARKLTKSEKNYSSNKGELLAAIHFMKTWRYYFQQRAFIWRTDHQALQWIKTMEEPQGMIQRWLETLGNHLFHTQFRDGVKHGNADALSRCAHAREPNEAEKAASEDEVTFKSISQLTLPDQVPQEEVVRLQDEDPDLNKIKNWVRSGVKPPRKEVRNESSVLRQYLSIFETLRVDENHLLRRKPQEGEFFTEERLCLPESLVNHTISVCHENAGGHMGINTTQKRLLSRYYFPGLHKKVEAYVGGCLVCQKKVGRAKDQRHTLVSVQEGHPWQKISIDYVGPLRMSKNGNQFLLTVRDCFTRWLEAIPMPHITAEETVRKLEEHIFSRWGMPTQLHSDQGAQFTSDLFQDVCKRLNIRSTQTPSYNPKSNPVERAHKDLTNIIKAVTQDTNQDWEDVLPTALLAMRTARHRYTGVTPFYAMHGREANVPVDLIYENPYELKEPHNLYGQEMEERYLSAYKYMRDNIGTAVERSRMNYTGKLQKEPLKEGEQVWLFTPIVEKTRGKKYSCYWSGPWIITKVLSSVTFKIQTHGDWNNRVVSLVASIDRLKRYKINPEVPYPQMNLTREQVVLADEFCEQGADPDDLPQFNTSKQTIKVSYLPQDIIPIRDAIPEEGRAGPQAHNLGGASRSVTVGARSFTVGSDHGHEDMDLDDDYVSSSPGVDPDEMPDDEGPVTTVALQQEHAVAVPVDDENTVALQTEQTFALTADDGMTEDLEPSTALAVPQERTVAIQSDDEMPEDLAPSTAIAIRSSTPPPPPVVSVPAARISPQPPRKEIQQTLQDQMSGQTLVQQAVASRRVPPALSWNREEGTETTSLPASPTFAASPAPESPERSKNASGRALLSETQEVESDATLVARSSRQQTEPTFVEQNSTRAIEVRSEVAQTRPTRLSKLEALSKNKILTLPFGKIKKKEKKAAAQALPLPLPPPEVTKKIYGDTSKWSSVIEPRKTVIVASPVTRPPPPPVTRATTPPRPPPPKPRPSPSPPQPAVVRSRSQSPSDFQKRRRGDNVDPSESAAPPPRKEEKTAVTKPTVAVQKKAAAAAPMEAAAAAVRTTKKRGEPSQTDSSEELPRPSYQKVAKANSEDDVARHNPHRAKVERKGEKSKHPSPDASSEEDMEEEKPPRRRKRRRALAKKPKVAEKTARKQPCETTTGQDGKLSSGDEAMRNSSSMQSGSGSRSSNSSADSTA